MDTETALRKLRDLDQRAIAFQRERRIGRNPARKFRVTKQKPKQRAHAVAVRHGHTRHPTARKRQLSSAHAQMRVGARTTLMPVLFSWKCALP